jgi:hypothetical protein
MSNTFSAKAISESVDPDKYQPIISPDKTNNISTIIIENIKKEKRFVLKKSLID